MKTLRRFTTTLVLTLILSISAFAGEMTTGRTGDLSTTKAGDMTTGITATDLATKVALNLYQSLLIVF